jgi:hypothetical protein
MRLHEWVFPLAAWREAHGLPGGEVDASSAVVEESMAGLADEMEIHLVATLLGADERIFYGVGDDLHGLRLVRTVAAPCVVHLKLARP